MTKSKKSTKHDDKLTELTTDLQRTRADFENFRKRSDQEKDMARQKGAEAATIKLLPIIDTIERAIVHIPEDIAEHQWVKGVGGLIKQLDKTLADLGVERIDAKAGIAFNPEIHQAVQMDEEAEGETEVIAEELQAGYTLNDRPIRHSMVRVTRQ